MTQPVIGITCKQAVINPGEYASTAQSEKYIEAILKAGGLPVLIPNLLPDPALEELRQRLDGILFTGGPDVDPALFGGDIHPKVYGVYAERDRTEIALIRRAAETRQPFMGICRGIQVINVALGGSLYTHIPDFVPDALHHWDNKAKQRVHEVRIAEGSVLARITSSTSLATNSMHHQGIKDVAPQLKATAWASDGLVEGVELPAHPFALGVQWHPEWLADDDKMLALFRALVTAAKSLPITPIA